MLWWEAALVLKTRSRWWEPLFGCVFDHHNLRLPAKNHLPEKDLRVGMFVISSSSSGQGALVLSNPWSAMMISALPLAAMGKPDGDLCRRPFPCVCRGR